ncbi:MAG TPA: 2-oxoacid:acceptor oxidoreductase family protein [Thermoplasmata archaeon]|nr:2-oxoacid:acceptor oxidoreductase family protein [Thermoplasmata archaeon]
MIEIRFHGRGGQGAVIASELLAQAAFLDGREPQSFPFFGVERRGAPVTAYARIDDRPIRVRTEIDRPDVVVVLDPGLFRTTSVTYGLSAGGLLLVNSRLAPEDLPAPAGVRRATIDADRVAVAHHLGTAAMPIVNTTMLGALARATGAVGLPSLLAAVERFVPILRTENRAAAEQGFAEVRLAGPAVAVPAPPPVRPAPPAPFPEGPIAVVPSRQIATAAWRTLTPRIDRRRCTRCTFCWKFCPDDALALDADGYPVLDLAHCKGCGICAAECPPGCIEMEPVAPEVAP